MLLATALLIAACSPEPGTVKQPVGTTSLPTLRPTRPQLHVPGDLLSRQVPTPTPSPTPLPPPIAYLPLQTELRVFELTIPQKSLDLFARDKYAPEQPAQFRCTGGGGCDGTSMPVNVRLRGASARDFPKKSWNLDFEDLRLEGREEFNLVAEYGDCSMIAEKLGYDMLAAMGVPAPRAEYVRLYINGRFEGVYLDIEEVDGKFTRNHRFTDKDADVWRCGWKDCEFKGWKARYQKDWQKKSNKDTDTRAALDDVIDAINFTPEPDFPSVLEKRLHLPHLLSSMAMDALISNSYIEDSESYFVHDRVLDRWFYVPWDLNNADMRWWHTYGLSAQPIVNHPLMPFTAIDEFVKNIYEKRLANNGYSGYVPVFSNLYTRILLNPQLRRRYLDRLEEAREALFAPEVALPRVTAMHELVKPYMQQDPYIDQQKFARSLDYVTRYVERRNEVLDEEIAKLRGWSYGIALAEVDPQGGRIVLRNYSDAPVSTSGLVLTDNVREAMRKNVPSSTLQPGESLELTSGTLRISMPARGELGLFNGRSVVGMLDGLFYGELPAGKMYARSRSNPERWEIVDRPR